MRQLIITVTPFKDGFNVSRTAEDMSPYEIIGACEETIRDIRKQLDNPDNFKTTERTRITPTKEIYIEEIDPNFPSD